MSRTTETCPCGGTYSSDGYHIDAFHQAHEICRAAWAEAMRTGNRSRRIADLIPRPVALEDWPTCPDCIDVLGPCDACAGHQ